MNNVFEKDGNSYSVHRVLHRFADLSLSSVPLRAIRFFSRLVQLISAAYKQRMNSTIELHDKVLLGTRLRVHCILGKLDAMRIILLIVCFAVSETIPARVDRSCGGKKISINDARYIVSIQKNGVHNCCGALITWQHVLTAASCIIDVLHKPLFHLTVATGPKSKYAWRYQHAIKNASFHPRFEDEYRMNLHYDLAVLTLSELVPDNDMPLPILLPNELPDQFAKGLFITFDQNPKVPRNGYLYKLPVVIYYLNQSTTDQAGDDPKWYSAFKGIMEDGDSSDVGDTGGPLVYNDTVIGIAAAMLTNRGRVFINVAACADFISKAIWEN